MHLLPRFPRLSLVSLCIALTAGCAGSSAGDSLQQSLEADPQLQDQVVFGSQSLETRPATEDSNPESSPPTGAEAEASASQAAASVPQPGDTDFIGPVQPADADLDPAPVEPDPTNGTPDPSLGEVTEDLRPYVQDWLALGLLDKTSTSLSALPNSARPTQVLKPNQIISRGEFALWLLKTNNRLYADQPAKKIRLARTSSTPAFQDVPTSSPYYGAIQGLAEAGIIPSTLAGNSTAVTFRPEAPLTREVLVLWKVPLDLRTPLPSATVDSVKATWGFQDAAQVEPLSLRAVLADHQTGDFANILRAFGYTTLFQPKKGVTQAEAAAALWRFGGQTEGISAQDVQEPAESQPSPSPAVGG
ncbi:MAG: S-layer homology domain-containing protein [Nodosilinea sp.]